MSNSDNPVEPKNMNWTKILLIASLGLNLLIVTAVGSAIYKNKDHDRAGQLRGGGQIEMLLRALPKDERRALRQSFQSEMQARDARARGRVLRENVTAAMLADPFDAAALEAALIAQREFRAEIAEMSEALWIDLYSNFSDEERATFQENLKNASKRKKGDRKDKE